MITTKQVHQHKLADEQIRPKVSRNDAMANHSNQLIGAIQEASIGHIRETKQTAQAGHDSVIVDLDAAS